LIELDRFIEFFQVDPHYFERTFLLIPDNSEKTYALLRKVLEKTGLAAIGKVTMSTKERVVLIHYYQNAIVATTLRYPDEVREPSHFAELKDLPEAAEDELAQMTKIVWSISCARIVQAFLKGAEIRCYIPHKVMKHFIA
jgi:DNA end-binding protein Ku